jgi:tetratricopeptide (TPR) repeat protein
MFRGFLKSNSHPKNKIENNFFGLNFISSILLGLIILLPVFYLPLKFSALTSSKLMLVLSVVFVSVVIVILNLFKLGKIRLSLTLLNTSIFLILLSYTLSAVFSQNPNLSFFGRDMTLDSWVTIIYLFTLFCLVKNFLKKEHIMFAIVGTIFVSGIISVLQILNILIPAIPSLGVFYSSIATTLGKWNDLALFSTLGLILAILILEQIKITQKFRTILYVIGGLNLILILVVNFNLSLIVLASFGILFTLYKIFNNEKPKNKILDEKVKVPLVALFVAIVSIAYLFVGTMFSQNIALLLDINHIEVRPSVASTYQVTKDSLQSSNLFFGSGPATFESQWPIFRPSSVLLTNFWNLDFRYGAGVISSFAVTTGVLGIVAWLIFFVLLIILLVKALFFKSKDEYLKFILVTSAFVTIVLWVFSIFYIASATLFVLAFIFTGIFISVAEDLNFLKKKEIVLNQFISILINLVLILAVLFIFYKTCTKFIGQIYFQKSVQMSVTDNYDEMEPVVKKALYFDNIDTYHRSLGEISSAKFYQAVQSSEDNDIAPEKLQALIQEVISNYEKAIAYDPNNYNNYFGLANFYSTLVPLSVPESQQASLNSYAKVLALKPNNPILFLQMAKLASFDDETLAEELIKNAISLKPNYFEAVSALVQFKLEKGNTDDAIALLESYLSVYPQDIDARFQAGVIYFEMKDFNNSITHLEFAVQINPEYQNAQYFLGLSYYEIGQTNKAIEKFEILNKANPNNSEIESMLRRFKNQ